MKGYPKNIATKQDFINLLAMPEYREMAEKELRVLQGMSDDTVEKVVSSKTDAKGNMTDVVTETIPNSIKGRKRHVSGRKEQRGLTL